MEKRYRNRMQRILFLLMTVIVCFVQSRQTVLARTGNGSIQIDGRYEEWSSISHTMITYHSWNGQCNHYVGLYMDEEFLYVHIRMSDLYGVQMPLNYMVLTVNGRSTFALSLHFANSRGQVDWSKDGMIYRMPKGTTTGIGVFSDGSYHLLGDAAFTVYESSHRRGDELELAINLEAVAKLTGIKKESIGFLSMRFPNIGAGSVTISGTSTNAAIGILCGVGIAGGGAWSLERGRRKRRGDETCNG